MNRRVTTLAACAAMFFPFAAAAEPPAAYQAMVARHAAANGLPASLVHRVIMRESRYNPRAVSKGNYGMMQIRLGTARAMGYKGSAAGLLDPEVNMTYAVKYLAGAYRAGGGNHDRAVRNYAGGYYYQAKAQGFSPYTGEPIGRRGVASAKAAAVATANPFAAFAAAAQQQAAVQQQKARAAYASAGNRAQTKRVVDSTSPANPLAPASRYDAYEPVTN